VSGGQIAVRAAPGATITNNAGASINGGLIGLSATSVNVTNSGSITGALVGIFAGTGGSSVFNAGTLGGGTAAIQFAGTGNTLTLATTSVISGNVLGTGSDTLQLGGTGSASFDVSQIAAAAQYQGFGTLNKVDSSVWTLTGTSTFAGAVSVNGGTLSVDGDLTSASSLIVNPGGTLGGNGTVGSTTINGGTLSPGNSIGLLTVSGSLVLTAASSYLVEVSPTSADRTNVTGAATLGGATVSAVFAPGTYVVKQYTILNAGSIHGTFAGPVNTSLPSGFRSSLSYDTNNVYLDLALAFTPPTGLNINQQNVANALTNFFNSTGGIAAVYGSLTPAGLTQASGELATRSQQTSFDAMNLFLGVLTDPFVAGRGPTPGGAGVPSFADDDDIARAYAGRKPRTASERDAYAAIYRKAPLAQLYEARWSVWAAGFGGTQSTDGNGTLGSNTATSRVAETAVGADYWFSPYTVAGFALAGGGTSFSVTNSGTGRSDLFQAGAFVRHDVGPAYVTGALAYGWQDITTDRTVTIAGVDHLQARFNANTWSGRLEGGYRFVVPWTGGVGLTPYASGQFTTFDLPAYAEQVLSGANAFALSYASKSVTATRSELGLRADKSFALNDAILTLRGRAAWAHDFNPDRNIAATFQALPGASFVVNGAAQARDAGLASASAEVKFANGFAFAATFEGQFSDVAASYAGRGIVRYAW
jgi:autotransporter-associated beta strand protein